MSLTNIFNPHMKHLLAEYQIDNKGIVEEGWRVTNDPYIQLLKAKLIEIAPLANNDLLSPHDIISIHPADGITYTNETIVVSYTVTPSDAIRERYMIPMDMMLATKGTDTTLELEYTIKYDTVTGESFAKVCDADFEKYLLPEELPAGIYFGKSFGVGVHMTRDYRRNYADFYFIHPDRDLMRKFYGDLYPEYEEDFTPTHRGYCMTVDQITREVVRIKRYVYWNDKELNHLELI